MMMLAGGLLVAALPPATLAQDNEAEKLFRDMEKKIKAVKAIEVVFTYQLEGKTAKGSLLLTDDNKARLLVHGHYYFGVKGDASFEMVSDGKRFRTKGAKLVIGTTGMAGLEPGGQTEGRTPKGLHDLLAGALSRGPICGTLLRLPALASVDEKRKGDFEPDDSKMTMHDFKAGAAEKVGERQAKVIRYRVGKGGNDDPKVTLWIDAETGLPLKRVYLAHPESEKIRITESYSEIKLNPKVNAKAFELLK